MTPQEVIAADAERSGQRLGAVLHGLAVAMDKHKAKMFHDNKSVVILEPIKGSQTDFEVHLFTADSPMGIVRSVQRITQQIAAVPKLERVYGQAKPQVIQMLRTSGLQVEKSDKKDYNWMAKA
jgi:hypothetical protein